MHLSSLSVRDTPAMWSSFPTADKLQKVCCTFAISDKITDPQTSSHEIIILRYYYWKVITSAMTLPITACSILTLSQVRIALWTEWCIRHARQLWVLKQIFLMINYQSKISAWASVGPCIRFSIYRAEVFINI